MKKTIICMLTLFIQASCNSTDLTESEKLNVRISKACEDSTWLNEKIEALKKLSLTARITQYTFQGENVFMIEVCIGCPDSPQTVYTCDGTFVCQSGSILGPHTCNDFIETATDKMVIWHN